MEWFGRRSPRLQQFKHLKNPRIRKKYRCSWTLGNIYYRKFNPNYAGVSAPLSDPTRKNCPSKMEWSNDCEEAFQKLKHLLCTDLVLHSLDFTKEFIVQTDASDRGV